jgi:hypothetical protein
MTDKRLWRLNADAIMPHRAQIMLAQGQDPNQADWRSIMQSTRRRTRRFLRKPPAPRILKIDSRVEGYGVRVRTLPPIDRVMLRTTNMVALLDTNRSRHSEVKIASSWSIRDLKVNWEALLDEQTLIAGIYKSTGPQAVRQKIGVRFCCLYPTERKVIQPS